MGFNNGFERKKFEAKWKKLRKEYAEAGMREEAIQEMYEFDLKAFNRQRADTTREQPLIGSMCSDIEKEDQSKSALLKKFEEALVVTDTYSTQPDRFRWIDEIQNEKLYSIIVELPTRDKEFLTYLVEGYTREEIAKMRGIKVQSVNKKITKFKNLLAEAISATTNV